MGSTRRQLTVLRAACLQAGVLAMVCGGATDRGSSASGAAGQSVAGASGIAGSGGNDLSPTGGSGGVGATQGCPPWTTYDEVLQCGEQVLWPGEGGEGGGAAGSCRFEIEIEISNANLTSVAVDCVPIPHGYADGRWDYDDPFTMAAVVLGDELCSRLVAGDIGRLDLVAACVIIEPP